MQNKIDFVISWVNGNDPAWQESKNRFQKEVDKAQTYLYRDWDNLQYWFRGVEKCAPWVNKIHFVTCGHLPGWLNTNHPQLHIVRHAEFMPDEYLPTFSSHAIELNFHRIAGLEEQFVYFNDDSFIIDQLQPKDFFKAGLPCDSAILSRLVPLVPGDPFFHYLVNDISIINRAFSKKDVLKKNPGKWFHLQYGKWLLKNIYYTPVAGFSGFLNLHLPTSFLKSSYQEVWKYQPDILHATSLHKFRSLEDVNQYVFSYWQFAAGKLSPRRPDWGRFFVAGENAQDLSQAISARKYKVICINDSNLNFDFPVVKEAVNRQLHQLFPDKSAFEL